MSYGLLGFVLTALVINISPGPAMLYVMDQSLKFGVRAGLRAAAGVELGVLFYVLLAAFGLVVIFKEVPLLYGGLQLAGAMYMVYLAYCAWPRDIPGERSEGGRKPVQTTNHAFGKGVLINLSNPKIGLFFFGLLPQFVPEDASSAWMYFLLYGLIFNISGVLVNITVGLAAHSIRHRIVGATWFRYLPPVLYVSIAVFALVERAS